MDRNTYIDDFATSATHDDIITIFFDVTSLMNTVHLPMYQWATYYLLARHLADTRFTVTDGDVSPRNGLETQSHTTHIDHTDITRALPERPATNRQVLQVTSRFSDPLGLFSPAALVGKLIFQDTSTSGLAWEELLPSEIAAKWLSWTSQLHILSEIHIPRWI